MINELLQGDAVELMERLPAEWVDLSFWSPPYHVGKEYERGESMYSWKRLLSRVMAEHGRVMKRGSFTAVNIADILCHPDPTIPRLMADNVQGKRQRVTAADARRAKDANPHMNRRQLASFLGCSEQTVQRRLEGNNSRGCKSAPQTKVLLTGQMLTDMAEAAGLHLYDRRVWMKDPCWNNSRWHSTSYRAVDEFEHVYIYWKPGVTRYDRDRLTADEWSQWGSRAVWQIPSVRRNDRHEAEFPVELALRVVKLLSSPGEIVLDPFVGSGTTAVAAAQTGRRWLGFDQDAGALRIARGRVQSSFDGDPRVGTNSRVPVREAIGVVNGSREG